MWSSFSGRKTSNFQQNLNEEPSSEAAALAGGLCSGCSTNTAVVRGVGVSSAFCHSS